MAVIKQDIMWPGLLLQPFCSEHHRANLMLFHYGHFFSWKLEANAGFWKKHNKLSHVTVGHCKWPQMQVGCPHPKCDQRLPIKSFILFFVTFDPLYSMGLCSKPHWGSETKLLLFQFYMHI